MVVHVEADDGHMALFHCKVKGHLESVALFLRNLMGDLNARNGKAGNDDMTVLAAVSNEGCRRQCLEMTSVKLARQSMKCQKVGHECRRYRTKYCPHRREQKGLFGADGRDIGGRNGETECRQYRWFDGTRR